MGDLNWLDACKSFVGFARAPIEKPIFILCVKKELKLTVELWFKIVKLYISLSSQEQCRYDY